MTNSKRFLILFAFLSVFSACKKANPTASPSQQIFIRAADLSFLPLWEYQGAHYFDRTGKEKPALEIFKNNGMNTVRLRLLVHPSSLFNSSLTQVTAFAQQIHLNGLKVWLDVHYSDTWADPAHQTKPAAWQNLDFQQLRDSVFFYTKTVMTKIEPEYIEIGNEINNGLLWPDGHITNPYNFTTLIQAGIDAVRETDSATQIMIHYAGYRNAENFFAFLKKQKIDYDIIGLSYYPWWHGKSLDTLQNVVNYLSNTYQKPVIIAETAYPFTLLWNDNTNNVVGNTAQLISAFPATETGQKDFLQQLRHLTETNAYGGGFCYWEPEWVTIKKTDSVIGSPWENLALFDFNNQALPAMEIFNP